MKKISIIFTMFLLFTNMLLAEDKIITNSNKTNDSSSKEILLSSNYVLLKDRLENPFIVEKVLIKKIKNTNMCNLNIETIYYAPYRTAFTSIVLAKNEIESKNVENMEFVCPEFFDHNQEVFVVALGEDIIRIYNDEKKNTHFHQRKHVLVSLKNETDEINKFLSIINLFFIDTIFFKK